MEETVISLISNDTVVQWTFSETIFILQIKKKTSERGDLFWNSMYVCLLMTCNWNINSLSPNNAKL